MAVREKVVERLNIGWNRAGRKGRKKDVCKDRFDKLPEKAQETAWEQING
jgi:hypothetical protein